MRFITVIISLMLLVVSCTSDIQPEELTYENKMFIITPGDINDNDFNSLVVKAKEQFIYQEDLYIHIEEMIIPERLFTVIPEAIEDGFDIFWLHGTQFNTQAIEIAALYPDINFIIESIEDQSYNNIWVIDRRDHKGFYLLGFLAAQVTQTNKVAWIGGIELPYAYGEINAVQQGLLDGGFNGVLYYKFVGDFNDAVGAKFITELLIEDEVDVIISSINLGNTGIFKAIENNINYQMFLTTKYTNKHEFAPKDAYITSFLYNYYPALNEVINNIIKNETGSFFAIEYNPFYNNSLHFPLHNVSEEICDIIQIISNQIYLEQIEIITNFETIEEIIELKGKYHNCILCEGDE